jgi:dihydrofolate reductase
VGKIVVSEFITVDGVIEDPGGAEDFDRGGWAFLLNRGDEGEKFKFDETVASDAMLLGRRTYEGFAEAWPSRTGEFADMFNALPKYVVSSTLTDPHWTNTTVVSGDLADIVARLKKKYDRDIVVHGSPQLVRALIDMGLVDELRLMVFPLVLGRGKPLFGDTAETRHLRLKDTLHGGDTLILTYEPVSAPSS